ncbi:hypothetical protein AKJ52_02150, partial [candidate division MSBL1 archaeon SCGC-AAA382C18]
NVPIEGVLENMKTESSPSIKEEIKELEVPYLGNVRYDPEVEKALGHPDQLLKTDFGKDLKKTVPL